MTIVLEQVAKTYHDGSNEVHAVLDASLRIEDGQFTVITGASGSGKSTLLNLIGCIDRPTAGGIRLGKTDVCRATDHELDDVRGRHIGYVFQSFNLIAVLSALENVEFSLRKSGLPAARQRDAAMEMLSAVGLGGMEHKRPNQLSGGQRQRVAIARALAKRPMVVLADEPTANLDSSTGAAVLDLMHDLQRSYGTSFVFSTHDAALIKRADAVHVIRDGRLETVPSRGDQ